MRCNWIVRIFVIASIGVFGTVALQQHWLVNLVASWPSKPAPSAIQYIHRPDSRIPLLNQRMRLKQELSKQVIMGEITLFEAAAWFLALNEPADFPLIDSPRGPGRTEEERACLQVLRYVKGELRTLPSSEAERVEQQLEEQLRQHLEQHGCVKLPVLSGQE